MSAPTTDAEAAAAIRAMGHHPQMAETMIGLFTVRRAMGKPLLIAYRDTLLASLSTETLMDIAKIDPDAAAELARREGGR